VKLSEALSVLQRAPADAQSFPVLLACGFTPLHLENYLAAHLQVALPDRKVRISTGLYDDLAGTLEQFEPAGAQAAAIVVEWSDLDPRLGYRKLGGWGQRVAANILETVEATLGRLEVAISKMPASVKVALTLPSLPLTPAFHTSGWQASGAEIALRELVAGFARRLVSHPSVLLLNEERLNERSRPDERYDLRADLHSGFPYTLKHADALGEAMAALIVSPQPKKGLITDLDDTLWLGVVGEEGHDGVAWDLASHAQLHGLYQQMLDALADQGVLIAIASKNAPEVVERALARADLVLTRGKIYPAEVHWDAKSGSVERILKTWNVGADSVVFVDDNRMELEEVRAVFPDMECILFPKSDYAAGLTMLRRLRDLFGKPVLAEEDAYRLESIKRNRLVADSARNGDLAEHFLATAEASITLEFNPPATDRRVVELVNKTNQFNLNGIRYTEAEWRQSLQNPGSFVAVVSYRDKFGPLGKIAVLRGERAADRVRLDTWVMSCRAFSRRIEYQCLSKLYQQFNAQEIIFDFISTPKNAPMRDFLSGLAGEPSAPLTREAFAAKCPKLYQEVTGIVDTIEQVR
jgi:FkbH-like protein